MHLRSLCQGEGSARVREMERKAVRNSLVRANMMCGVKMRF